MMILPPQVDVLNRQDIDWYDLMVDAHDARSRWVKLWHWIIRHEPVQSMTITLPRSYMGIIRIKKIDNSKNPVFVVGGGADVKIEFQYDYVDFVPIQFEKDQWNYVQK